MKKLFLVIAMVFAMTGCFNDSNKTDGEKIQTEILTNAVAVDTTKGMSESFELGFTKFNWVTGGSLAPIIDPASGYDGTYSCKFDGKALPAGQSSTLQIDVYVPARTQLVYFLKTDMGDESLGTNINVYVDGNKALQMGDVRKWFKCTFYLEKGNHTIKWSLEKSPTATLPANLSNSVWLDCIVINSTVPTPVPEPTPTPIPVPTPVPVPVPTPVVVTTDPAIVFFESWNNSFGKNGWGKGGTITSQIQTYLGYGADNMYSCRFDNRYLSFGQISYIEKDITLATDSKLTFYTISNTTPDISTIKLLIDGVEKNSFDAPHLAWTEWNFNIPPGRHMLRWEMKRTAGAYDENKRFLWLDAIKIAKVSTPTPVPTPTPVVTTPAPVVVPTPTPTPTPPAVISTVTSLVFSYPVSPLKAIAGVTKISCKVAAKKSDGSLKTDAVITYSTFGPGSGTVDANGVFTGTTPGLCNVVAKYNGLTANSKTIEVLPANYIDLPFVYNGATYNGKTSAGTGTVVNPDAGIKITVPTTTTFDADGFFTLKGSVSYTGADRYVWVSVNKPGVGGSSYYLEGNFATRIWLRCGAGSYTVKVVKIQDRSNNLNYTGDMTSFALGATLTTFTVNNTRNEDGKFYYPSYWLQSDDISIYNKAMELTYAKTAINDKIRALHDWTCAAMTYDNSSLTTGKRKKQDAISALNTGSVVCEGYTSIYNAMLRSIGIKAKAVAGNTASGLHAWTNVLSGSTWYFVDTTWDDNNTATPMTRYFMLTSLTGINNDHAPTTERIERSGIVRIGLTEND